MIYVKESTVTHYSVVFLFLGIVLISYEYMAKWQYIFSKKDHGQFPFWNLEVLALKHWFRHSNFGSSITISKNWYFWHIFKMAAKIYDSIKRFSGNILIWKIDMLGVPKMFSNCFYPIKITGLHNSPYYWLDWYIIWFKMHYICIKFSNW